MSEITYFESGGKENTSACIKAVKARVSKGDIKHVVVASSTGATALKLAEALGSSVNIVCVSYHAGMKEDEIDVNKPKLADLGVFVHEATHVLSGVERSVNKKYSGAYPALLIADVYRTISQGFKVAVEVMLSACDASLIPSGVPIISIGGSHEGCDTAVVMNACISGMLIQDLKISEIICMPKQKMKEN